MAVKPTRGGSSPRVRGKPCRTRRNGNPRGLIPACAGKTPSQKSPHEDAAAHPRVCGENKVGEKRASSEPGSSPRVRGKPLSAELAASCHRLIPACAGKQPFHPGPGVEPRLIPACAGKTLGITGTRSVSPAHPRVCGENTIFAPETPYTKGSSPRVRGKRSLAMRTYETPGLIPA